MRRVEKQETDPTFFVEWKRLESDDWKPTFSNLQKPEKHGLHEVLLREQGYTCCYCGREIDLTDSHIEHFRPQHLYPELTITYSNLFASCLRETGPGLPLHCGHLKGEWFQEHSHISPLDETCEAQFSYTLDGQIIAETPAASTMCDVLGLNRQFLRTRRRQALEGVFDPTFILSVSDFELERLIVIFRAMDEDRRYTPFFHVVAKYAEQLLTPANNNPTST
jgi:uncharacterized protein (TIGR02646 family)